MVVDDSPEELPGEKHASASQLDTFFNGCRHKWGLDKIDKLPRKEKPSTILGKKFHTQRERWLRDGISPDVRKLEGRMAKSGLKMLPAPGVVRVEVKFKVRINGVLLYGAIDGYHSDIREFGEILPTDCGRVSKVIDHKSTSDFIWMKTPAKLATDFQRILYAGWSVLVDGADAVDALWLYTTKRPPHASKPSSYFEDKYSIARRMVDLVGKAEEMLDCHNRESGDLPKNFSHCSAYGGCDFKETCHEGVSSKRKFGALMARESLMRKLRIEKKQGTDEVEEEESDTDPLVRAARLAQLRANTTSISVEDAEASEEEEEEEMPITKPTTKPSTKKTTTKKKTASRAPSKAAEDAPKKRTRVEIMKEKIAKGKAKTSETEKEEPTVSKPSSGKKTRMQILKEKQAEAKARGKGGGASKPPIDTTATEKPAGGTKRTKKKSGIQRVREKASQAADDRQMEIPQTSAAGEYEFTPDKPGMSDFQFQGICRAILYASAGEDGAALYDIWKADHYRK